jgi:hypothetical protein
VSTSTPPSPGSYSKQEYDGQLQPHNEDGGAEDADEQGDGEEETETAEAESTTLEDRGSKANAAAGVGVGAPPVLHGHGAYEMGMMQRVVGLWSSWTSLSHGPKPNLDSGWLAARASPPMVVAAVETEERDAEGDEGAEEETTEGERGSASTVRKKKAKGSVGGFVHRMFGSGHGGHSKATAKQTVRVRYCDLATLHTGLIPTIVP